MEQELAVAEAPSIASSSPSSEVRPGTPMLSIRPPRGWAAVNLREVWHFRELLTTLAGRDLKVRYKQTALGVIWVVLQPIMAAGVFSVVFGQILKAPTDGIPYFLFSFTGMLGWNLFSNVISRSSVCLTGNSNLISKIFFPRLVLPMSTVCSSLVDYGVSIVMLAVLMVIYHVAPAWPLLLVPLWTLLLLMLALGVGLFTAALTVRYRDVQYILPMIVNILMYASPIAYAASSVPKKLLVAYNLNPLSPIFEGLRSSILGSPQPQTGPEVYALVFSVVALWIGVVAFKQMERQFADII
jgi:lipopolysaccharide transport system permease protein